MLSLDPSTPAGVCDLTGTTLTYQAAGSCVVNANQAGDDSYAAAAEVQQTIWVTARAVGSGAPVGSPPQITASVTSPRRPPPAGTAPRSP